jgi:GNAT superfamily N-acetyltransferase
LTEGTERQPGDGSGATNVRISTDRSDIDLDWLHAALSQRAYWALGRTRQQVEEAVAGSMCFAAFIGDRQVGFARVVTDGVTFGWICDVFVDEDHRGRGIGSLLMEAIVDQPQIKGFRRLALATRDAHELYRRFGFDRIVAPERWMERRQRETGRRQGEPERP